MSLLTRQDLHRTLKQGEIGPLYLLFGPETCLRDLAAQAISDAALADSLLREFNESTFSLANAEVQQAIAAAEHLPMMASRRVILIRDFAKLREADEEFLGRYIDRPVESSVVIFIADDLDKRRKLTKTLLEVCSAVEFSRLRDAELVEWARKRMRELRVQTDARTLHHIVALVGCDVRTLSNELQKLATAALGSGLITMEMVDELVVRSRELSNFELTDNLIACNRKRALQTLQRLMDEGVEPLMLVGLLGSNYRRLALAKELMLRGAANQDVFKQVGVFGRREEFLACARRADANALARNIERIAATDLSIKTSLAGGGARGSRLQLELLICELSA